jgi:hypothetical protein
VSVVYNGDHNQYASLGGKCGENGEVVTRDAIRIGALIGIHHKVTQVTAFGYVEDFFTDRMNGADTIAFRSGDWFRVIFDEETLVLDAENYVFRWHSDEDVVIISGTFCRTTYFDDIVTPGQSIAFVDMTGPMWRYGTPYPEHEGRLGSWCAECGKRLHSPLTGFGTFEPTQAGLFTECEVSSKSHTTRPVLIWTPRTWYFDSIPLNMKAEVRDALLKKRRVADPFSIDDLKAVSQHAITDGDVWFEHATEPEDWPEGYKPDWENE